MTSLPLSDLRVIDLSSGIAAETAALILAEAGADVIKIEGPAGDRERLTAGFAVRNRSKRSVVLDLPADLDALHRLLVGADILFHSYTPSQAHALGLDDAALAERYPSLILCGVPGFPAGHSAAELPARDTLVLAEAGILDEQAAVRRDGPAYLRVPLGSWHAASLAAIGVLARLFHRDRGGAGGVANTSLFQGALVPMTMYWNRAERPTEMLMRGLPKHMDVSIFECSDGRWLHIMTGCDRAPLVAAEFARRGDAWVAAADASAGDAFRIPFPHFGAVRDVMRTRPRDEWLTHLQAHDVPVQPVLAMGEIYCDEQARANGYAVEVDDPCWGRTTQPGMPFTLNGPLREPTGCRPLGADTEAVLGGEWSPRSVAAIRREVAAPLEGIKVLDFGVALAGPLATMILADLGAEVIKVEPPDGDMMRILESNFAGCQRGKRAIALQLKDPASRPTLERLVEWADVIHHNLRLPAAERLGIGYEALARINPRIVHCHVSAYGPRGPRKDWPGMDQMFQSSCGWELAGAGRDNPPIWYRFGFTDHLCALASVIATLLGLRSRDMTGESQSVAASLLGAAMLTISETIRQSDGTLTPVAELDSLQMGVGNFERIYRASNGWIAVAEPDPDLREKMLAALGVSAVEDCEAVISGQTAAATLAALQAAGAGCALVRREQRTAFLDSDEHGKLGLRTAYPHPVYGQLEHPGAFWHFGDLAVSLRRAPPTLGQHTEEILREFGLAPERTAQVAGAAW